jgi:hypothetical protein
MLRLFALSGALALLAALLPMAAPAQHGPPITVLADCNGKPEVRPARVVFACADYNLYVAKIRWSRWGEQFATGIGVLTGNDCIPSCVAGHFHDFPAMVIVAGREGCPNGQIAYQRVAYVRLIDGVPNVGPTMTWQYRDCSMNPMNGR